MRTTPADEKAQALPLALMALALGALLVSVSLSYISTSLVSSRVFSRSTAEGYAADAGIEDAIWSLRYGDLAEQMAGPGDTAAYSLSEAVNGIVPAVTVTRERVTLATDGFESGNWVGGQGWLAGWQVQADADVTGNGTPHAGSYHLRLRRAGYASRTLDLSGRAADRLEFWAKASSFESGDSASLLLSSDGASWATAWTWADGDDDGYYHPYSIDVSSYSGRLWIAFDGNMDSTGDYLYVDDIAVVNVLFAATDLPQERFESGFPSGGAGWLGSWTISSSSSVVRTSSYTPFERYHLQISGSAKYARRSADLSGRSGLRLRFQAKVRSFEAGDEAYAYVSSDGDNWTRVKTWTSSDTVYQLVEVDLSPYAMTSQFWVRFVTKLSNSTNDYLYVDNIEFAGAPAYRIVATAGDSTATAVVSLPGGEPDVHSWTNNE